MQPIFRRTIVLALAAVALFPVSEAKADWWGDAALVKKGIAHAVKQEWMTADDAATYRSLLTRSTSSWRRLSGSRSSNLAAVLHDVARQWQAYTAPRALTLFSMLDMNVRYLGSDAMPAEGANILDQDGVVYRAFPGQGLQFHPLANFARLNSLMAQGDDGDAAMLSSALLDRAIPRAGTLVWEYYFPFGGGSPPWTSGMAQAVAARALAAQDYLPDARKAYLALSRLTQNVAGGPWVRLYSFSGLTVLNAQLQAALSLADYGRLNQDAGASQLADSMLRTAGTLFPRFDTGAWSLYALGGPESPLNYHLYVVGLLKRIAAATQDPLWSSRATRFDRYTTEAPVVSATVPSRPVKSSARISFRLSKISRVTLSVGGASSSYTMSRGSHSLYWSASGRRPGRYAVTLSAVDLAGNRAVKKLAPIRVARLP
ncbi:MAG TPA: D-glucuronyl C5-epimerase family protein [Gaiellaceae bacterium]